MNKLMQKHVNFYISNASFVYWHKSISSRTFCLFRRLKYNWQLRHMELPLEDNEWTGNHSKLAIGGLNLLTHCMSWDHSPICIARAGHYSPILGLIVTPLYHLLIAYNLIFSPPNLTMMCFYKYKRICKTE